MAVAKGTTRAKAKAIVTVGLILALGGCGSSSGVSDGGSGGTSGAAGHGGGGATGNAGATGGGAGTTGGHAGNAGAAGGGAGTSGGNAGNAGAAGGGAGASGGNAGAAGGGAAGTTGACAEPVPCEGYDDRPDAHLAAAITCLSPSEARTNAPFTLAIYGHHLATGAGQDAIVTLDSGTPLNGVPVTACHLDVQVPADQLTAARQVSVVVSPGGWTLASPPALLTVH